MNTSSLRTSSLAPVKIRQLPGLLHGRDDTHAHIETLLDPCAFVVALWLSVLSVDRYPGGQYLYLSLVLVTLTYPGRSRLHVPFGRLVSDLVLLSSALMGLLIFFGWATRSIPLFPDPFIRRWLWITPTCLVGAHSMFRLVAPLIIKRTQRAVIVGMNEQGVALANRLTHNPYSNLHFVGFFDDRVDRRIERPESYSILGRFGDLPAYVAANQVRVIYLSLPMATQERTLRLLDQLRDTTASIYFVPDQFVTELIQGRMSTVVDIPVVAVCETPFVGIKGAMKRIVDLVIAGSALLLLLPVLLAIVVAVKMTSPGPVIFRQRRYGLDGEEIVVYKFRSMLVEEDGADVKQAQRNDARVTPIGAFLRKTSLDELPQLLNVLQGRMSLVGPRPHAVAHNELYRKVIKGYMLRHKVRPGITGWAQVNGLRGETDTVAKMEARIRSDIDYLRNWSLRLDFYILLRTVVVIAKTKHTY